MTLCHFLGAKLMHFDSKTSVSHAFCYFLFCQVILLLSLFMIFFQIVSKTLKILINCYFLPK